MTWTKCCLAAWALLLLPSSKAPGQENPDPLLPVKVVASDEISKHLDDSEIVVVGMVGSMDATNPEGAARGSSTPGMKLNEQFHSLRNLRDKPIPGLEGNARFSDRITLMVVETNNDGDPKDSAPHQQKVRAFYEVLGAHPYVMSNPVIFLIHNGSLVRCYGNYQEPGPLGIGLQKLTVALLSPEIPNAPVHPEIAMRKALAMRPEKGDEQAAAYLSEQLRNATFTAGFYQAYLYFWTEAQVRSGAEDPLWAALVYDALFTTCQAKGMFGNSMQVVSNLCTSLHACGRFGRLTEVMAVWENGQKMAGNRMNISSYPDRGPAIPCLPEIRHRDMPATRPSQNPIPAGTNSNGFHVVDAGAFQDYASLQYSAGRWREALEYTVWIRNWATDKNTNQPVGEYATTWYATTSDLISCFKSMGFQDEALAMTEEGLAAPHGQTYHGRWKIFLAAEHLHALMRLGRPPSDIVTQYENLIGQASRNGHINKSGVWSIRNQLAETLIQTGRIQEGESLYDALIAEGSRDARRARLTHWIKCGRIHGVEDELKDLLRFSRETAQKMGEYELYRDYADFLEKTGRHREALLMRREVIRLAKTFGLFTHLPVEQSKLALLLHRLGDPSGSDEMAALARNQIKQGRLPRSIIDEINGHLAALDKLAGSTVAQQEEKQNVDLQPHKSMVIPIENLAWNTYLTLTNPGNQVKTGHLRITGQPVGCSVNKETDDILITLLDSKPDPGQTEFACSVDPGTYRLIHLRAAAESNATGELQITWQDGGSSSNASVTLEAPESGVRGAIIQAGDYRANPFYGVPVFLQYVSKDTTADSPPLRFRCSHSSRVEVYQIDGTPLAIDAQGNGSLLDQGDELFVKSDGSGHMLLPLSDGSAGMHVKIYPDKGIPEDGLTIDIEAFVDGSWQLHSRNRLAK